MLPQELAATPVAQVRLQVMAVLLEPVTRPLKSCVRLVMTLACVGEMVIDTELVVLFPHPITPSAAARASIVENLHRLIRVLQKVLDLRPHGRNSFLWRLSGLRPSNRPP